MKIYISLPISGKDPARSKERADYMKTLITGRGHTPISPLDISPTPNLPYSHYMGRGIEALMECDAILRCSGWSLSKGCCLESECAHIFGKKILDHINQLKPKK